MSYGLDWLELKNVLGCKSFDACAGIEVTASHNPIDYNGMKIVKAGSQPLDDTRDFGY